MSGFPENILDEIEVTFKSYLSEYTLIRRPLRPIDPGMSLGLFPTVWEPIKDTNETGQFEPVISRYNFRLQSIIKNTSEIEARSAGSLTGKLIKAILFRNPDLRVRLGVLTETVLDTVERFQRFGISSQSFLSNELRGSFLYFTKTDFWVETESTNLAGV